MNNVYILLELAKLDSEVYNLLMRASKPFNTFINSNVGLRATIRDSVLTRRDYGRPGWYHQSTLFTFKGSIHRLDGPASILTVYIGTGCMDGPDNTTIEFNAGQTGSVWWEQGTVKRYKITDSQNAPSD